MSLTAPDASPEEAARALHAGALHLLRRLRSVDVEMGLGTARSSVLSVLVFGGPRGIGELAAIEQVRTPTMTRLVDRLERDGLATRERDPEDRRHVVARATKKGERLLHEGREKRVRLLAEGIRREGLGARELTTLREAAALMERLAR